MNLKKQPLVILDMANNAMGSLSKGLEIIDSFYNVVKNYSEDIQFSLKFQYRQLFDGFINPDYIDNFDYKYVKRFVETQMSMEDYYTLKKDAKKKGFITMCTAFDNASVGIIEEQKFDILKIASCSFLDWELLERVSQTDLPIIASTASAKLEDIDKVVNFFQHRDIDFSLMHCIAEYPTKNKNLELNQIDLLRDRYKNISVGFSTHEDPSNLDAVKIAIGKGARILERHIDLDCDTKNAYSSTPTQLNEWLYSISKAYEMCGIRNRRYKSSKKELEALHGLKRGVWLKRDIKKNEEIKKDDLIFSIPLLSKEHLVSDNISKYKEHVAVKNLKKGEALCKTDITMINTRSKVLEIVRDVKKIIVESGVVIPDKVEFQISHHFGINKYYDTGAVILTCVNNDEYAKKLIIMLPGQLHPEHFHKLKKESFHILHGEMDIFIDSGNMSTSVIKLNKGEIFTVDRGVKHGFHSKNGVVFEEISTRHFNDDSFYSDKTIMNNKNNRKTNMTFFSDWIIEDLK
jgi:sialic acid synthase SpsE/D-lyxose ketol-isomerase